MSNVFPINYTLLDILGVTATCSFLAECFVLYTYYRHKDIFKAPHMKLVMNLIIADLVETFSNFGFFFTSNEEFTCVANGFLRLYGLIASVIWVAIISDYSVYLVRRDSETHEIQEPSFKKYTSIAIGVPSIFCCIPLYGNLTSSYEGYTFDLVGCLGDPQTMLLVLYPPVIATFIFIIYNFKKIKKIRMQKGEPENELNSIFKYPAILLCCWIPGLITRIVMVIYGDQTPFVLEILLIVGLHSMGLTNGLFYGITYRKILRNNDVTPEENEIPRNSKVSLNDSLLLGT